MGLNSAALDGTVLNCGILHSTAQCWFSSAYATLVSHAQVAKGGPASRMQSAAARNLGEGIVSPDLGRPEDQEHQTASGRGDSAGGAPRRGQKAPTIMGP